MPEGDFGRTLSTILNRSGGALERVREDRVAARFDHDVGETVGSLPSLRELTLRPLERDTKLLGRSLSIHTLR
jgi:hypothetical protein